MDLKIPSESEEPPQRLRLHRLIPHMMTLTAMAAGLTAIQYALTMQWERAVIAILVAVILDGLDGATARMLKVASDFGAQLDNLADFLSFGIAPAIILYTWILEESGKVGWMAMIIYATVTALRLARFNVEQKEVPAWRKGFFSGIPSPGGAGLALLPLIIWIQWPDYFARYSAASPIVSVWTIIVAILMISRIPTFSTKAIYIPARMGMAVLTGGALMIAAMLNAPWQTMMVGGGAYIASIPFAVLHFQRLKRSHQGT